MAKDQHELESDSDLRVDKWLWCARFFKSRSQATAAVTGGLVHVNGERVKPSRLVHPGDTLNITRAEHAIEVVVRAIPTRRGPATQARECYEETAQSIAARERRRANSQSAPAPSHRPDKHDRRVLRTLRGR